MLMGGKSRKYWENKKIHELIEVVGVIDMVTMNNFDSSSF